MFIICRFGPPLSTRYCELKTEKTLTFLGFLLYQSYPAYVAGKRSFPCFEFAAKPHQKVSFKKASFDLNSQKFTREVHDSIRRSTRQCGSLKHLFVTSVNVIVTIFVMAGFQMLCAQFCLACCSFSSPVLLVLIRR